MILDNKNENQKVYEWFREYTEFGNMDTQKEQITTKLHNCWSDPNSEIVKRMNSFSEKFPEILKPILEGSK